MTRGNAFHGGRRQKVDFDVKIKIREVIFANAKITKGATARTTKVAYSAGWTDARVARVVTDATSFALDATAVERFRRSVIGMLDQSQLSAQRGSPLMRAIMQNRRRCNYNEFRTAVIADVLRDWAEKLNLPLPANFDDAPPEAEEREGEAVLEANEHGDGEGSSEVIDPTAPELAPEPERQRIETDRSIGRPQALFRTRQT